MIDRFNMHKITGEVIKSIKNTIKTGELNSKLEEKALLRWKYRGIFHGNALSPLLFVIAIMPLNHILRKCTDGGLRRLVLIQTPVKDY